MQRATRCIFDSIMQGKEERVEEMEGKGNEMALILVIYLACWTNTTLGSW